MENKSKVKTFLLCRNSQNFYIAFLYKKIKKKIMADT